MVQDAAGAKKEDAQERFSTLAVSFSRSHTLKMNDILP